MPTITGTEGTDILSGGADDDTILGFGGNDQLTGNGGNDTIEGGSGDDILTGSSGLDVLTGGDGVDVFRDTAAGLNGDRITDFLTGDRIQLTDLSIQNANIGIDGSQLTFNGGSVTIDNLGPGRLIVREIQNGGVEVRLQGIAHNDFNGDGRSDVLWRNDDGQLTNWLSQANGGYQDNSINALTGVSLTWQVAGTGDFNGDGRADVLWRDTNGLTIDWLGRADGSFSDNYTNSALNVPLNWQVQGIGDFNGDGRDDVLWRDETGTTVNWLGQADGSFSDNYTNSLVNIPTNWHIEGVGDFNGDGRDDILWRETGGLTVNWLGEADGSFTDNYLNSLVDIPTNWEIEGIGDFNGDGRDDILWRDSDGTTVTWLGEDGGGFGDNYNNSVVSVPNDWQVESIGDFNGDGRDDILWRNTDGTITNWLGQASGGFADNYANSAAFIPNDWHVQPDALF